MTRAHRLVTRADLAIVVWGSLLMSVPFAVLDHGGAADSLTCLVVLSLAFAASVVVAVRATRLSASPIPVAVASRSLPSPWRSR